MSDRVDLPFHPQSSDKNCTTHEILTSDGNFDVLAYVMRVLSSVYHQLSLGIIQFELIQLHPVTDIGESFHCSICH